jgi:hypothetical protein
MSHTTYITDHSWGNRHPANEMQEVSDTETVDHEYLVQNTEVSDTETIGHELDGPRSACHSALNTTELLEHIISFLPMKKIFTIQRVSKLTPKETCEPSALGWSHNGLWRLQRPPPSLLTLVSLNPELRPNPICKNQRFGLTCAGHGRRVMVQWGPTPIKQCHSLFDTYISDPPCKNAEFNLTVRFKKAACNASDSGAEYPIKLWVSYITANSDSGLTFQDVLLAALNARGQTECKDDFNFPSRFEHPGKNDAFRYRTFSYAPNLSLREVIDLLPEYTKIPKILPTPHERAELRR